MMSNLRESPRAASLGPADCFPSPVWHATRWQAIRAGMWKAGKLGFVIGSSLIAALCTASMVAMLFIPRLHEITVRENGPIGPFLIAKGIAGMVLLSIAFGTLYGAIPGAVIGAIVAGVRWRRPSGAADSGSPGQQETTREVGNE